jgi:hypothetical protein
MVKRRNQYKQESHKRQGKKRLLTEVKKISAKTPYDFKGRHLTPYGGLLPLVSLLEKLKFKEVVEQVLRVKRIPHAMSNYQFMLSILIALYIGFSRLAHLVHIATDPLITGMVRVDRLPVQSSFWRFLQSLRIFNVKQLEKINGEMMVRVWEALNLSFSRITIALILLSIRYTGSRWGRGRGIILRTKGSGATSLSIVSLHRRGNLSVGSNAGEIGPPGKRWHSI